MSEMQEPGFSFMGEAGIYVLSVLDNGQNIQSDDDPGDHIVEIGVVGCQEVVHQAGDQQGGKGVFQNAAYSLRKPSGTKVYEKACEMLLEGFFAPVKQKAQGGQQDESPFLFHPGSQFHGGGQVDHGAAAGQRKNPADPEAAPGSDRTGSRSR